jgi:hypothetical protein
MYDHRVYLKVKIKSLAAEAKIIRTEERKNKKARQGLAEHRRTVVRNEARHSLLAYGFLRGKTYHQLETKCHQEPNWDKVGRMVEKYGVQWDPATSYSTYKVAREDQKKRFQEWTTFPIE